MSGSPDIEDHPSPDDEVGLSEEPGAIGGIVQRVDVREGLVLLKTRRPGQSRWWLLRGGPGGGVGALDAKPSLTAPTAQEEAAQSRLRRRVEGATLLLATEQQLVLEQEGQAFRLAMGGPKPGAPELGPAPSALEELRVPTLEALRRRGPLLLESLDQTRTRSRAQLLLQAVAATERKLGRRAQAVEADLSRCLEAATLAAQAATFTAEAGRVPRGATEMTVTDWSSGQPRPLTMRLDPKLSAREQLEGVFRRARRLRRGADVALARLEETRRLLASLQEIRVRVGAAMASDEALGLLEQLATEARALAPRDFQLGGVQVPKEKSPVDGVRCVHRTFVGAGTRRILVGKGARDNDVLTTRLARPQDHWLHAKGLPGAHVVVPLDKGETCPPELLIDAAHLAVHFSDARGQSPVEVQHTQRRHVRKPRGAAPGAVQVGVEKVLLLRIDAPRLARLLASELG